MATTVEAPTGVAHWVTKQHASGPIRIFAWEKYLPAREREGFVGTILLIHGSSMASTPTFDLQVPGRPDVPSLMDYLANLGYDVWCFDCEGYGRSDKSRDSKVYIADGADDAEVVADYIAATRGVEKMHAYGVSSGALRAAMFAERRPDRVGRLALDAFVWTGEGSPTLEQRRKRLPELLANNRRPIDSAFIRSIFTRDHPGTAEDDIIEAFAHAVTALDDSIPNGTYVDMCQNLPVCDPRKITVPTMITRGEYDGIASLEDLLEFFKLLPNPDKQFNIRPHSAHSGLHEKNFRTLYHVLEAWCSQPEPVYRG